VIVMAFLVLAGFGLREAGFRSGPSTREVSVHTAGPGGAADFVELSAGDSPAVDAVTEAAEHDCKPPGGVVTTVLDVRGAKAVFVTEIVPSGRKFRFRWGCRLRVLHMADE
jgi:hypothetical protein